MIMKPIISFKLNFATPIENPKNVISISSSKRRDFLGRTVSKIKEF